MMFNHLRLYTLIYLIYNLTVWPTFSQSVLCELQGERENLGLYGGMAGELHFLHTNNRLFCGVDNNPYGLFFSEDTGNTWYRAFPYDSLDINCGDEGWGGGIRQVVSNSKGWVAVETQSPVGSVLINFNNGDTLKWQTAFDDIISQDLKISNSVTGMAFSKERLYITNEKEVLIIDSVSIREKLVFTDYSFDLNNHGVTNYSFKGIAAATADTLDEVYIICDAGTSGEYLFYIRGFNNFLIPLPSGGSFEKVYCHPLNPDTIFVSGVDSLGNDASYRSTDKGSNWVNISNSSSDATLQTLEYSPYWKDSLPLSNGIILLSEQGSESYDMGDTWVSKNANSGGTTPKSIYPNNIKVSCISDESGIIIFNDSLTSWSTDRGLEAVDINGIGINSDKSEVYLATTYGVAYTTKYSDTTISDVDKWVEPYGEYPLASMGVNGVGGIDVIKVNPFDDLHIIGIYSNAFYVSTSGVAGFSEVPLQHLSYRVLKDIAFIDSNHIIAVSSSLDSYSQPFGEIWYSNDRGYNWISDFTPTGFYNGNCIEVARSASDTVIYIGTGLRGLENGKLWKADWIANNLYPFTQINEGPVSMIDTSAKGMIIKNIVAYPNTTDTIYLLSNSPGQNDEVLLSRSNDGGSSYTNVINFIEKEAYSLIIDSNAPDTNIYLSMDNKVFHYMPYIDSTTTKYAGITGEAIKALHIGSLLSGTSTGFYSIELEVIDDIISNENDFPIDLNYAFNIYPNPARSNLTINLTENRTNKLEVDFYNVLGKMAYSSNIQEQTGLVNLDISMLQNGCYMIVIKTDVESYTGKVVIQR